MSARWSTGLRDAFAAGRKSMDVAAMAPIHATVASRCNQYVSANAQVGGGVMELVESVSVLAAECQ